MEGSSETADKEEITEKKAAISLYHPCFLLEETLRALFKCLGVEISRTNRNCSVGEADTISPENSASKNSNQKSSEEVLTTEEEAPDPPSTTEAGQEYGSAAQSLELNASIMGRSGSRRSPLTPGPGPQIN